MGEVLQVGDHVAQAVASLSQYEQENHPNEVGTIELFSARWQGVEDALWERFTRRGLSDAVGAELDLWGVLLAEPRAGLLDDDYRRILGAVILARTSDGSNDRLAQIAQVAAGASQVRTFDLWPPTVRVEYGVPATLADGAARRVVRLLRRAKRGGVMLQVIEWTPAPFAFEDDEDGGLGFGSGGLARRTDLL